MKIRTMGSGTLVLCSLFAAAMANAAPPKDGPEDRGKWEEKREEKIKAMHAKLGLTPDQEKALKAHRETHREAGRTLREETREKREAMRVELQKASVDESKVRALHAEIKDLEARKADHRLEGMFGVRKILTPEQFKKFQELMDEKKENGKGRHRGEGKKGRRERREGPE